MQDCAFTLAASAFPNPDFHCISGTLKLTGSDIMPCQCVVIRSEISFTSSSPSEGLRKRLMERLVARDLKWE